MRVFDIDAGERAEEEIEEPARSTGCLFGMVLILLVASSTASAYTQAQIDQAALVARQIDIVDSIADDVFQGRNNNTAASTSIQTLLINELKLISDGLNSALTGDDAYRQVFNVSGIIGTNLLGVIPGSDLANEYVMVGAHYDHLGLDPVSGDIRNGASDNAAGVAAVLAIGAAIQSLPAPPRRSVILALWDAEEDGLVGSAHYLGAPLVPITSTITYVNFDGPGVNLLPSIRDVSFAIGTESGGAALQALVQTAIGQQNLDTQLLSRAGGQDRSDHASFINAIPSIFFTDGTGSCYHQPGDEIETVDLEKLREQSQSGFRVVIELAETSTPPTWTQTSFPPFFPIGIPVFEDAVVVADILNGGIANLDLFPPWQQPILQAHQAAVQAIVTAGPGAFNCLGGDCIVLQNAVVDALNFLVALPCNGFSGLTLIAQATPPAVNAGEPITYTLTAENEGSFDVPLAQISDLVPADTTYVPGSASDGGSESGGLVTWPALTLAPTQTAVRSFSVLVDSGLVPIVGFADDIESGDANWTTTQDAPGSVVWQRTGTNPHSGSFSWFAADIGAIGDQVLMLSAPFVVPTGGATLSFQHQYDTEPLFDGGVVEISSDGGVSWNDLGPHAITNPYNGTISTNFAFGSPIVGRPAYTGTSVGYILSEFDLSPFADSSVRIRFRMATDVVVGGMGWWVDDVAIDNAKLPMIVGDARVEAGGAAHARAVTEVLVPEPHVMILLFAGALGLAVLDRRHRLD